jgi:hypothetical protein
MRHRPNCMIAGLAMLGALVLALASTPTSASKSGLPDNPAARHEGIGIWKAYTPHGVKGELDNYDPIGLAAGALIKADCSINWRDPGTGKLYCFSTSTSLVYFLNWPQTNIRRAREGLEKLTHPKPAS